jgi:hypothetical protein
MGDGLMGDGLMSDGLMSDGLTVKDLADNLETTNPP